MRKWKRTALETIPRLRPLILGCDNVMQLWIELQLSLEELYQSPKMGKAIDGIWRFARWSMEESHNWDTQEAVCCAFYEHIPKMAYSRADLPNRLSEKEFERLKERFKYLLTDEQHRALIKEFYEKKWQNAERNA
jgi:hypothetical protein